MSLSVATRIRKLPNGVVARWAASDSFVARVAQLASGSALAQSIAVASTPLITRIYGPEEFSQFGLFLTALGISNAVATLKFEAAIVSAKRSMDALRLIVLAVLASLPLGILTAVCLSWMQRHELLGFGALSHLTVSLLFPTVVAYSLFSALRQWFVRRSQYGRISKALVSHSATRFGSQLTFGLGGMIGVGLTASEAIARFVISMTMIRLAWGQLRRGVAALSVRDLLATANKYSRFPRHATLSTLIDTVAHVISVPLFVECYGTLAAGSIVLVQRVIAVPSTLIGLSVADVFHRRLASSRTADTASALRLLDRTAAYLLLLGLIPCAIVMLAAPATATFVCGESWETAGHVARALAPLALAQFAASPISLCFSVYQAHRYKIAYDFLCLFAAVVTIVGCAWAELSFMSAVWIFSGANVFTYLVYYLLMRFIVRALHDQGEPDQPCAE